MRIALVSDTFLPATTSAAVMMRDLAREFVRAGVNPTVITPDHSLGTHWRHEQVSGVETLRLQSLKSKDVSLSRRFLAELLMPVSMLRNYRRSPFCDTHWDGVVWYSPTIFLGPFVRALRRRNRCPSYLILRDIFPDWAVDTGVMSKGAPYYLFKGIERFQYTLADTIGVQTPANLPYFKKWKEKPHRNLEVLNNWMTPEPDTGCSIDLSKTALAGRKICVYAGNMGIAQDAGILLEVASLLSARQDIGFVFVGRGTDAITLRQTAEKRALGNVCFFDEIDPSEIPGLFSQCAVGLVTLALGHKTHNMPGKLIAYMHYGLPVLARLNPGNDVMSLVAQEEIGRANCGQDPQILAKDLLQLMDEIDSGADIKRRCLELAQRDYSAEAAARQILDRLRLRPMGPTK